MKQLVLFLVLTLIFFQVENISAQETIIPECPNCLDLDPGTTSIPDHMQFKVDAGFFGDLTFQLAAALKYDERMIVDLNKTKRIIIMPAEDLKQSFPTVYHLNFIYPAKQVKEQPIEVFLEKSRSIKDAAGKEILGLQQVQSDPIIFSNISEKYFKSIVVITQIPKNP